MMKWQIWEGGIVMERLIIFFSLIVNSSLVFSSMANIKVIYGKDDRLDVIEVQNSMYLDLAKSTAAMIPNSSLVELNSEQISLGGMVLSDTGVCEEERFSKQPVVANCSGFLVRKDVIVTAGHCVKNQFDCDNSSWVFDYKVDYADQSDVVVDKRQVYKCKEVISQTLDETTQNDYSVIRLTEAVEDRKPLKLREKGTPNVGDSLVVIGHPSGLPSKISGGAQVRSVNDVYMVTNLDTYGGNSGSAVFNAVTGEVEGILVRGANDYIWNSAKGCRVSNILGSDSGRGEDVTLIKSVQGIPEVVEDTPRQEVPAWWLRFLAWLNARNRR